MPVRFRNFVNLISLFISFLLAYRRALVFPPPPPWWYMQLFWSWCHSAEEPLKSAWYVSLLLWLSDWIWFLEWLVTGLLNHCLSDWRSDWLNQLKDCLLTDSLTERLLKWLGECLTCGMFDLSIRRLTQLLKDYLIAWVSTWIDGMIWWLIELLLTNGVNDCLMTVVARLWSVSVSD